MQLRSLELKDAYEIVLQPRHDERGYFMRVYCEIIFRERGLQTHWIQESQSLTKRKHTIRGLHFQRPPYAETKLVRVVAGAVWDVIVDLRKSSPTYGRWAAVELSAERFNALYVPKGFAHGFCTLTDDVVVLYKIDTEYAPAFSDGIRWNDEDLGIPWPAEQPYMSERDRSLRALRDCGDVFV